MRLPNGDQAIIDSRKLTEYSLSPDHDDGKHKARLFQALLGIGLEEADRLIEALKSAAATGEAQSGKADHYGQRYVIDFEMTGPSGPQTVSLSLDYPRRRVDSKIGVLLCSVKVEPWLNEPLSFWM